MSDLDVFRELEEGLWRAVQRSDSEALSGVVADEFVEYCRFGHVYDRDHLIASQAHDVEVAYPFDEFEVDRLAEDIALVSYVNTVTYQGKTSRVRRSSVWTKPADDWLLRFQQAPTLPD